MDTGVVLGERYRLDEPIAAGGVGQVWRATDLMLQRLVAVKLLRPEYADHPETLARFRAEARHAGSLAHPSIAQVYDYGDNPLEGPPYLVMELVDGPSLADILATEPVTPPYALDVLASAATGLAAAHDAGLVHRDIKPGNILLGPDGQVKITDFGIAHAVGSAPVTDPGLVMGTTQYLAPERIAGGSVTPAADLYSLGIVMHECLTGVPPYEGTPAEVMAGHLYLPLPPLPADTPPEVEDLVARLTVKDPRQRLSDAAELAALALTVRTAITSGEPMPRPREAPAVSPVGGYPAPGGGLAPGGHPDTSGGPLAAAGPPSPAVSPGPGNFAAAGLDEPADSRTARMPVPADARPGTALALREPGPGHALALRDPGADRRRRAVDGTVIGADLITAEDFLTGGRARPRRRRRAALGIGVLIVAGGVGLTGAVVSGALHTSPVADRGTSHPSLSAVQPNTAPQTRHPAPKRPGKHAKPHASRHAKTSAPATAVPPASPAHAPSTPRTSTSGSTAPKPQPTPGQSTPSCLLGILCP